MIEFTDPFNQAFFYLTLLLLAGFLSMWFFWIRHEIKYYEKEDERYRKERKKYGL